MLTIQEIESHWQYANNCGLSAKDHDSIVRFAREIEYQVLTDLRDALNDRTLDIANEQVSQAPII